MAAASHALAPICILSNFFNLIKILETYPPRTVAITPTLASQPIFFGFFHLADDFRAPKRICGIPNAYLFMTGIEHFLFCDSGPRKRKNTFNGPCLRGSDRATFRPLNGHTLLHRKADRIGDYGQWLQGLVCAFDSFALGQG